MRTPVSVLALLSFLFTAVIGPMPVYAQDEFRLPVPGVMVHLSPPLDPPILKGIKVDPDNPFRFEFIMDQGDSALGNEGLKEESSKLIKYFLASLTIPEKDLWVNLSPYEKDRIIPNSFGLTEMGRDLLAEDYMLKQITASLIYPEGETGRKFWKRVYAQAVKRYGTTNIPVNTFNKVWIVPETAVVFENAEAGTAYVVEGKLKVMLEQDYLSLQKHVDVGAGSKPAQMRDGLEPSPTITNQLGSQVVREIVIPELTREVNENKNFAKLRQIYSSLILATWYKKKIKDSILSQVYADKNKTVGVRYTSTVIPSRAGIHFKNDVEGLYQEYLKAFKKGVYNYIKEDIDPQTQEMIPRKYFSGGFDLEPSNAMIIFNKKNADQSIFRRILDSTRLIVVLAGLTTLGNMALGQNSTPNTSVKHQSNMEILSANTGQGFLVSKNDPDYPTLKNLSDSLAKTNFDDNEVIRATQALAVKVLGRHHGDIVKPNTPFKLDCLVALDELLHQWGEHPERTFPVTLGNGKTIEVSAGYLRKRFRTDTPEPSLPLIGTMLKAVDEGNAADLKEVSNFVTFLKNAQATATDPSVFQFLEKLIIESEIVIPSNSYAPEPIFEKLQQLNLLKFETGGTNGIYTITIKNEGRFLPIKLYADKLHTKSYTPKGPNLVGPAIGTGFVATIRLIQGVMNRFRIRKIKKETVPLTGPPEKTILNPQGDVQQRQIDRLAWLSQDIREYWADARQSYLWHRDNYTAWEAVAKEEINNAEGLIRQEGTENKRTLELQEAINQLKHEFQMRDLVVKVQRLIDIINPLPSSKPRNEINLETEIKNAQALIEASQEWGVKLHDGLMQRFGEDTIQTIRDLKGNLETLKEGRELNQQQNENVWKERKKYFHYSIREFDGQSSTYSMSDLFARKVIEFKSSNIDERTYGWGKKEKWTVEEKKKNSDVFHQLNRQAQELARIASIIDDKSVGFFNETLISQTKIYHDQLRDDKGNLQKDAEGQIKTKERVEVINGTLTSLYNLMVARGIKLEKPKASSQYKLLPLPAKAENPFAMQENSVTQEAVGVPANQAQLTVSKRINDALKRWQYVPTGSSDKYALIKATDEPGFRFTKNGRLVSDSTILRISIENSQKVVNLEEIFTRPEEGKGITLAILKLLKEKMPDGWSIHIKNVEHHPTLIALLGEIVKSSYSKLSPETAEVSDAADALKAVELLGKVGQNPQKIPIAVNPLDVIKAFYKYDQYYKKHPEGLKSLLEMAQETRFVKDLNRAGFKDLKILFTDPKFMDITAKASNAQIAQPLRGGIDLTPANMHLKTRNTNGVIRFHLNPAQLTQLKNAPGFTPVIINLKPMMDLAAFLGIDKKLIDQES